LKQAQEWQTVLESAQPEGQNAYDGTSYPLSKLIITEARQFRGEARGRDFTQRILKDFR